MTVQVLTTPNVLYFQGTSVSVAQSCSGSAVTALYCTVKSVHSQTCQETTCLVRPCIFGRTYISIQVNLSPETTCLERPHFCGQWGGLSRQVLLYTYIPAESLWDARDCLSIMESSDMVELVVLWDVHDRSPWNVVLASCKKIPNHSLVYRNIELRLQPPNWIWRY